MNYILQGLQQYVTPNGRTPEFDYLVNQLLGAGDPNSSGLGAYLQYDQYGNARTPEDQIKAANALFGQTLTGLNPYSQNAYAGYAGAQGNQYLSNIAKGNPGASSYIDYLNSTPLRQWVNR